MSTPRQGRDLSRGALHPGAPPTQLKSVAATSFTLCVTVGCPSGIGPEIAVRALRTPLAPDVQTMLVGDGAAIGEAARALGVRLQALPQVTLRTVSELPAAERRPGEPSRAGGLSQLAAIDLAADLCLRGEVDAMVTGPVSKQAITEAGVPFLGHTEHLAARTHTDRVTMLFVGPKLRVALVTTHVALVDLPRRITREAVGATVFLTETALRRDFACPCPRLAVTGLNPHAGEGGLLGREELDVIAPALEEARARCPQATIAGPMSAEAAFRLARDGRFDAVVAMYHDQATIASKLLDFGDAVNVTVGLPFIRTSVDHGTAYDIAGKYLADPRGMSAALRLAVSMARARRAAGI